MKMSPQLLDLSDGREGQMHAGRVRCSLGVSVVRSDAVIATQVPGNAKKLTTGTTCGSANLVSAKDTCWEALVHSLDLEALFTSIAMTTKAAAHRCRLRQQRRCHSYIRF